MTLNPLNDFLMIGVVQTSLNNDAAWVDDGSGDWEKCVQISEIEERRAKKEIRHFLASLRRTGSDRLPDIVLFPELSIPLGFEPNLIRAAEKLEAIVIAGLDYRIDTSAIHPTVSNEAVVIVPRKIRGRKIAGRTEIRRVGKTYSAPGEKRLLQRIKPDGVKFLPHPSVWVFEGDQLGAFAVAICYDFMDLDRIVMYRNRIQTLFILAYNKDTTSFDHIAEALSRMLFCNIVVCNCGKFGGSVAVSPFQKPYERTVYRHSGQKLPNAQNVQLPLRILSEHQAGNLSGKLKSLPPGFIEHEELLSEQQKILTQNDLGITMTSI